MTGHRRRFSPQFKAEAEQMVIETGKPIAAIRPPIAIRPLQDHALAAHPHPNCQWR